jgi:2-methylisocitrate lyase-like PEP mutase family enzyme
MNFKELHHQKSPVLICNIWDVASAKSAENLNFQAIGTSSGAIASTLGYKDGEEMSFEELAYIVKRITKSVNLPLTVDLEAGYSRNPIQIAAHIMQFADLGVIGINIEDSIVNDGRKIVDADVFSKTLEVVCSILTQQNCNMFINVRTDTFLLKMDHPVQETITRAKKYQDAGGQGIFTPFIEKSADIESVIQGIDLPLNVMCMPNLPNFSVLEEIGVNRISMGTFGYNKTKSIFENQLESILKTNSFKTLFS